MLNRTRFGFDLRAAGASESAALASGVSGRKMILIAMLASGALAGLIGMPSLLGESHTFMSDFPAGYGFTGIAIALLGRNHPLGMAFGAFLWAFLDKASTTLDDNGYESEISVIMQGIIVLAVVIAYESVQRWGLKRQQQKVGAELARRCEQELRREGDRVMAATTTPRRLPRPRRPPALRLRLAPPLYFGLGGLVLFSLVRSITGTNDITSVGQVGAAISVAVPILLAGLGGLWSERAGVVNLGLEGMMILGTWFGAWAGYQWGPWTGVIVGIIGGMLGGLLHAIATVTFGVNHIVSGVAINILALGATRFLSKLTFGKLEGGSATQSPQVD